MEQYRQTTLSRLLWWLWWLVSLLLHPTKLWKAAHFWSKIQLWLCFYYNRLTCRYREKKALIEWVRSRVRNYAVPDDFSSGWTDGILLCALLDSMYPGSCPRYDLLNPDNSLSNMQLAFMLIEKHTHIRLDITAEEVVEGQPGIKKAIRSIVAQLKLISAKRELQKALGRLPHSAGEIQYAPKHECFAKGMGLILAVRGRRATFNVFTRPSYSFCIVVEIRGPDGSVSKQTITNKSPRVKVLRLSDYRDENGLLTSNVLIEYQIFPGKIAVKYRPVLTGKHELSIIWHGQHVMGSPYVINVEDSRDEDEQLTPSPTGSPAPSTTSFDDVVREEMLRRVQRASSQKAQDSPNQSKMRKRRIIKRIIKCNGKEFIIDGDDKEELKKVLMSISNHKGSSRKPRALTTQQKPQASAMLPHERPETKAPNFTNDSSRITPLMTSPESSAMPAPVCKVETPLIVISAASSTTDEVKHIEQPDAARVLDVDATGHAHEAVAHVSLPYGNDHTETIINPSLPASPSEEKLEAVPQISNIYEAGAHDPPTIVTTLQRVGFGAEDMPSKVGDDNILSKDNSKRLFHELPVIEEETEKRVQTGLLEESEVVQTVGQTTECSMKYEFRIHRSSVTVNIQTPGEELELQHLKTEVKPAVILMKTDEKTNEDALVESKPVPMPRGHPARKRILRRQSTAYEGPVEDKRAGPPILSPCCDTEPSSPSSVKNMIESWEKKQKEQIENMSENAASPKPVKPFMHQSHSSPKAPVRNKVRMSKMCEDGESSGGSLDAVGASWTARPDVYEEVLVPPVRSQWPNIRYNITRPNVPSKRASTCSGIVALHKSKGRARSQGLHLTFPRPSSGRSTSKEKVPDNQFWHVLKDTKVHSTEGMVSLLPVADGSYAERSISTDLLCELSQEYIDDEILNDGTLLLDRYTAFKDSKAYSDVVARMYSTDELHELLEASSSHPENCVALGSRLYFGQVGRKNYFQVDASRAGVGPISVGIQGPTEGSVIKVSVSYSGLGNYTVMYKVAEPGYYIINVRWADWPVPDSPYMCKISA